MENIRSVDELKAHLDEMKAEFDGMRFKWGLTINITPPDTQTGRCGCQKGGCLQ